MAQKHKYIYGIMRESETGGEPVSGIDGLDVHTITYKGLAALVSDREFEGIDPTLKNVRAHTSVQEAFLARGTLLPMGFGMIAGSDKEVTRLLEKNHQELTKELDRLAGKMEVELKVFWRQEAMLAALRESDRNINGLKTSIQTARSATRRQKLLVEAGQKVEQTALKWKSRYAEPVFQRLRSMSVESVVNEPRGVTNLLNASFLVEKSGEPDFEKEVQKLDTEHKGKLDFKYIKPVPPYNFLRVKLEPLNGSRNAA